MLLYHIGALIILIGGLFKSICPTENLTGPASETTGTGIQVSSLVSNRINLGTLKIYKAEKNFILALRNENVTKSHC
jgi:hypothetical protein